MPDATIPHGKAVAGPADASEMGTLIRAMDWAKTPLGPVETWSPSLRVMTSFLIANRFPLLLWWGPQYIQIYNDAYRPILGTKHPTFLGRPVSECWDEIWHVLQPLIDTPFHGGPATWSEDLELEIRRSNFTEETHFTVAYSPVPDETAPRGIGGVLATVHEITEKVIGERRIAALHDLGLQSEEAKTAQQACALASEMLANHTKDIPFALLYLIDPDGKRARLAGASGIGWGEAASPLVVELDAASEAQSVWPFGAAVSRDAMVTVENLAARFANPLPGPWSDPPNCAVIIPLRSNKAHELAGLMVAGVSPRLKLDDQYRSFFELAAARIATAIATARAYEEERKRAEALAEIDRAKTAFFSNVSHEFRTPLTLMLGPLDDAMADGKEPLGAGQRERITMAQRNGLRLQKLVNALLDFSRAEAGRIQAAYQPTDLSALTHDLASSFASACEKAGVTLTIDTPALAEPVFVDREMWEKIVLNLVSNAFKFTLDGEIKVSLAADGQDAVLRVSDTGTGIPEHELPLIFDRFHRVTGAQGRTHEGTGIGLALVRELVKLHNGSVTVESTVGRGTAFAVRVPFGRAHLPQGQIDSVRQVSTATHADAFVSEALRWLPDGTVGDVLDVRLEEPPPMPSPGLARDRILLVDDNADMRHYVRRLLITRYEVQSVADGEAALAACRQSRPDLVLSDVMMPGLDGLGFLRAVRADPALADLPVILLSARVGEEASVEGLEAGADDYLIKPFSARELLARVASNLEMARLRKRAENALREMNESLERRVQDRTRALEAEIAERRRVEAALHQTQRLEAIGQLTGGLAHDFNNLLTVVIGQAESIIMAAKGNEPIVRMALSAQRVAERGAQLTAQLLAFSRQQVLRPRHLALPKLMATISELIRRALGESIAVAIDTDPHLWPSLVDPSQFESAILNLALNARDAMPDGGRLKIAMRNAVVAETEGPSLDLRPGDYVVVTVADTGPGMSPDVQGRCFEPFYTTKEVGKGTGLGLSQVYGFARQSGGTAMVEASAGWGTTIALYLPRTTAAVEEMSVPGESIAISGQGKTVLIVEDQEEVREVMKVSLTDLGYRVLVAPDATAAQAIIEGDETVDLLLTDIVMPNGVNGIELGRSARRLRQDLKIVLVSGYPKHAKPQQGGEQFVFLEKPFRPRELAETVAVALRGS